MILVISSPAERLRSSYSSYKILQTEYVHTHLKGNKEQEHVFQEVFIILFIKEDNWGFSRLTVYLI